MEDLTEFGCVEKNPGPAGHTLTSPASLEERKERETGARMRSEPSAELVQKRRKRHDTRDMVETRLRDFPSEMRHKMDAVYLRKVDTSNEVPRVRLVAEAVTVSTGLPDLIPEIIAHLAAGGNFTVTVKADGWDPQEFRCTPTTTLRQVSNGDIYRRFGESRVGETPIYTPRRNGSLATELRFDEVLAVHLEPLNPTGDLEIWRRCGAVWRNTAFIPGVNTRTFIVIDADASIVSQPQPSPPPPLPPPPSPPIEFAGSLVIPGSGHQL